MHVCMQNIKPRWRAFSKSAQFARKRLLEQKFHAHQQARNRPKMDRKTKAEAARTRSDILDAEEIEMQECGVSGAAFDRIARRAKVARGAIHGHVEDKAALRTAMVERTYLPLRDLRHSLRSEQPEQPPTSVLRDMLLHGLDRLATDAHHRRVSHIIAHCREDSQDDHPIGELLRNSFEDTRNVAHELGREAQEQGLLKPRLQTDDAADMIMAFMLRVYTRSLRYADMYSAERDWEPIVDALLAGLFLPADK